MRALAVAVLVLAVGCSPAATPTDAPDAPPSAPLTQPPSASPAPPRPSPIADVGEIVEARSSVARNPLDAASARQLTEMVVADRAFTFDLYRELIQTEDGNLFFSPYSISTALSMALAGANGDTYDELAQALGVGADESAWHAARNRLELELAEIARYEPPQGGDVLPLTLEPTNAIFGQSGYPFKQDFLDVLAANYGAGMSAVDFMNQPEPSRLAINDWVAERTRERIEELLPQGSISDLTRAVLVNGSTSRRTGCTSSIPSGPNRSPSTCSTDRRLKCR